MRILLLEDHTADADLICRHIEKGIPNCKIDIAISLNEAKRLLRSEESYHVALLDVNLPDGSGLELLMEIREKNMLMSVIVLTGYDDEELTVSAMKAGADDFVVKSEYYFSKLIHSIEYHLESFENRNKKRSQIIKVLYTEHHDADVDLTIRHFKKYAPNILIEHVTDGTKLLERIKHKVSEEDEYHILLIDYLLPGTDGLELTKKIRQELKLDIPIVIITGHGNEEVAIRALNLGVDDYLVKRENYVYHLPSLLQNVYQRWLLEKQKKALQESDERLNLFFTQALDGFFFMMLDEPISWNDSSDKEKMLDYVFKHQRITKANQAILDQYRATKEQYIGITPNDLFAHDLKLGRKVWKDFFDKGQLHIDTEEKKFDGSDMIIEGDYICLYDSEKRITGHFGVQKDVTDIRRAEEILHKTKSELEEYFENDISADYVVSLEGEIFSCNKTFLEFFGFEEKAHAKRFNISKLYRNPNDRKELLRRIIEEHKVENFEVEFITLEGKPMNVILNAIGIYNDAGELVQTRGYVVDITARKQAEEAVKLVTQRLKLATKSVNLGIWDYNIKENNLTWDDRMYELYGIKPNDFSGAYDAWENGLHPNDKEKAAKAVQDAIMGIREFHQQFRVLWPNEEVHYLEAHGIVQRNSEGEAERMVGVNWDITNQKKAENELLKLSRSVEQSPASVIITDLNGNIEYVNPKYCAISGYKLEEVIGKNPRILKSGNTTKEEYKALWKSISSGNSWSGEFLNKRKNGTHFWEYASISAIKNDEGILTHYLAVKEDITDRKRLERTQEILVNITNAVLVTNSLKAFSQLIFNEIQKVINTNNFYIALYNEQTQMISTPFIADQLDADLTDFPAKKTMTGLVINSKKSMLIDNENFAEYLKKGEIELIGLRAEVWIGVPLFSNDKVIGAIVIQNYKGENTLGEQDLKIMEFVAPQISLAIERKKAEEDMKKALAKAEESDRLKTAFMNNISHEIRTPLNGILGFAPFIIEPDISQGEKESFLNALNISGERLMNTVTAYMDISLIVSGNMKVNKKSFDLLSILQNVYAHFINLAQNKNIELKLSLPNNSANLILNTDEELFRKSLLHLVDNAIKFTSDGFVEIGFSLIKRNKEIEKTESKSDSFVQNKRIDVEVFIKDSGKGISQEAQEIVFSAFMQENESSTRAHEGSGLGLSIAKGIIQLLGGKIRLESELNVGTSVFVEFPIELGVDSKNEETKGRINGEENFLNILIAEDDELNFFYFKTILKGIPIHIYRAENGQEAVDICNEHPEIDLVIMDIKMPVMNGLEATRQIKATRKDLPIIAVTAYAMQSDKSKILEAGCNDYFSKPIAKDKFIGLISKYLKF